MGSIKQINIQNWVYYFFNDINIKNIDSNLLEIERNSHKNTDICYIGYTRLKKIRDYESIHGAKPLHFIIGEVDQYTPEKNGNKYLIFASTDKNKILETMGWN